MQPVWMGPMPPANCPSHARSIMHHRRSHRCLLSTQTRRQLARQARTYWRRQAQSTRRCSSWRGLGACPPSSQMLLRVAITAGQAHPDGAGQAGRPRCQGAADLMRQLVAGAKASAQQGDLPWRLRSTAARLLCQSSAACPSHESWFACCYIPAAMERHAHSHVAKEL